MRTNKNIDKYLKDNHFFLEQERFYKTPISEQKESASLEMKFYNHKSIDNESSSSLGFKIYLAEKKFHSMREDRSTHVLYLCAVFLDQSRGLYDIPLIYPHKRITVLSKRGEEESYLNFKRRVNPLLRDLLILHMERFRSKLYSMSEEKSKSFETRQQRPLATHILQTATKVDTDKIKVELLDKSFLEKGWSKLRTNFVYMNYLTDRSMVRIENNYPDLARSYPNQNILNPYLYTTLLIEVAKINLP